MSLRNATAAFDLRRAGSRARKVRRLKSAGFTLVELLVVISIIGMLMALLLPAINSARETGRQNTCRSNLSNLATAILLYDGRNGKVPGYMNCLITQQGNAYKDPTTQTLTPVSWAVELLSDLDRGPLYELWRTDYNTGSSSGGSSSGGGGGGGGSTGIIPRTKVYIEILTCPSDDADKAGTPLSYVANTGVKDLTQSQPASSGTSGSGGSSATVGFPRDWQANGVFFDNYSDDRLIKTTASTRGPQVVMQLSRIRDPKDKTILFTENVDGGDYTFDTTTAGGATFPYAEIQLGCIWDITAPVTNPTATPPLLTPVIPEYRMNVGLAKGDNVSYQYCRPSSRHPQGVNIAFSGKNVMFVRDTISYFIYAKLMASDDAGVKAPGGQVLFDANFRTYQMSDGEINP